VQELGTLDFQPDRKSAAVPQSPVSPVQNGPIFGFDVLMLPDTSNEST